MLQHLVTDYIRSMMSYNLMGDELSRPVAVQFGFKEFTGHIICASDDHKSKFWSQARLGYDSFDNLFSEWLRL